MTTTPSITSGQEKQITRFAQDALDKAMRKALNQAVLGSEGMQRVIERGDEFQEAIETTIATKLRELSLTTQFADEEVPSNLGYVSGYSEAKPLADQLKILRQHFPNLGSADEKIAEQNRPANSEGWFAIPRWQSLAPTYNQAVELVLDALKKARKGRFHNWRQGKLGPDHLRETDRKRLCFERLGEEQTGHDVLVVAAQFGLRHRGRSVRRARAVMGGREFGLGAFENGIMLLTHPERLAHYNDLWIDCAGDEYAPDAAGRFGSAPYLLFHDGRLGFDTRWFGHASGSCGSASGLLP